MSYTTEAQKTHSEKITLVTCEAVERLKLFNVSGANFTREVDYFVVGVKDAGTIITSWTFNPLTKILTILGGADPKTRDISVTYRFFFSTTPINLPYDLVSGEVVEWLPYVSSIGGIGQQLDEEQLGIVLESQSSVTFANSMFFDNIFDTLIWENKNVKFYSLLSNVPASEKVLLFDGVVESKSFNETSVNFRVKDFAYKLKNQVRTGLFSESDGIIIPSIMGTPKRRVYGKVDNLKCVSLDAILGGYLLDGTVSASSGSNVLTGVGTSFLSQVSQGDELVFTVASQEKKVAVESIQSNTSLTLGKLIDFSVSSSTVTIIPAISTRHKNRVWHISGHKLRNPITSITSVVTSSLFLVNSVIDLFPGDEILVNNIPTTIRRISGNYIVTSTNIVPTPSNGDEVERRPVSAVYFGHRKLEFSRDYTITNLTNNSGIIFNSLAEFNITEEVRPANSFVFTNGSRSVTTSAVLDLRAILKPRDWIRSSNIAKPTWYEILQVSEQSLDLRVPFSDSTATELAYIKNIEYIDENSLITVNTMGMEFGGTWIKTPADAVRNMLLNDAEFASVNESSFTQANADADYILSLAIPENIGQQYPLVRDVITQINESVMGSLYGTSSTGVSYGILSTTKPGTMELIEDHDILGFSVQTNQKIINSAKIKYRPYIDIYTGENAFKLAEATSSFVDKLIGIKSLAEKTSYLYEDDKALIIAQRLCLVKSLSNAIITIKSKMNLAQVSVNDRLYISLDRLFKRFGGTQKKRVCIVSGTKNDGLSCEVTLTDLGNMFNRVMSISPNYTVAYSLSTEDDRMKWAYVLDNNTETADPASDIGLSSNIIG